MNITHFLSIEYNDISNIMNIMAKQIQFETMTPSYYSLSTLGKAFKNFIEIPSYIVTDNNHGARPLRNHFVFLRI